MPRYAIAMIASLCGCFALQALALRASGGKTLKSESNYFSSLARLQTEPRDHPRVMLLGSSMTGRLGDRAQPVAGVANLGCDGGSAVVTLRAIDRGQLPAAPVLIVEANSLAFELEGRGKEISAAISSDWFRWGTTHASIGATARPAAFAYSWLMARSATSGRASGAEPLPTTTTPSIFADRESDLAPKPAALVDEIAGIFDRLRSQGCEVLLVMLPPGVPADSLRNKIARAVAAKSGVQWWDLTDGLPEDAVGFSDGVHLDAPSAQKVMLTLMREVRK